MAPSYATADLAYYQAVNALGASVTELELHLPPPSDAVEADVSLSIPPSRPRERTDSVAACQQCAEELEALEAGSRENHQCTHGQQDEELRSRAQQIAAPRRRQPNAGVIRQDIADVRERFDIFSKALSTLASVCDDAEERRGLEEHLLVWAEYVADVKARAFETLQMLETPVRTQAPATVSQGINTAMSVTYTQQQLTAATGQQELVDPPLQDHEEVDKLNNGVDTEVEARPTGDDTVTGDVQRADVVDNGLNDVGNDISGVANGSASGQTGSGGNASVVSNEASGRIGSSTNGTLVFDRTGGTTPVNAALLLAIKSLEHIRTTINADL